MVSPLTVLEEQKILSHVAALWNRWLSDGKETNNPSIKTPTRPQTKCSFFGNRDKKLLKQLNILNVII